MSVGAFHGRFDMKVDFVVELGSEGVECGPGGIGEFLGEVEGGFRLDVFSEEEGDRFDGVGG